MRKEVKIRGIKIVYDELGKGDVILFIHGQPLNRSMWDDQIDTLSGQYSLIIPDLRGYGESDISEGMVLLDEMALDLICLMEQLSIKKAIIVGLSMGGQIALEMYKWAPEIFNAIILADTDARGEDANGYLNRVKLAARIVEDGMEKFTNERIKQFMCANTFTNKPEVVAHVEKMMKTTVPEGAAAAQRGRAERPDYTSLLFEIDFPALIIVGDQDVFTPVASAQYISERIKDSRLVIIKNSGHISNMEQPEAFNKAMVDFITSSQYPGF